MRGKKQPFMWHVSEKWECVFCGHTHIHTHTFTVGETTDITVNIFMSDFSSGLNFATAHFFRVCAVFIGHTRNCHALTFQMGAQLILRRAAFYRACLIYYYTCIYSSGNKVNGCFKYSDCSSSLMFSQKIFLKKKKRRRRRTQWCVLDVLYQTLCLEWFVTFVPFMRKLAWESS